MDTGCGSRQDNGTGRPSVFVTGGASGTGYAICREFAGKGWDVALTSRDVQRAGAAAARLEQEHGVVTCPLALDLSLVSDIEAAFAFVRDTFGRIDALVLCAADLGLAMDPFTVDEQSWDHVVNTNLRGMFFCCREAARAMGEAGGGSIVAIGSNTCRRAIRNRSAYIASKGGMVALARALALDFGPCGIRVNVVAAGSIHTERWDECDEDTLGVRRARIPLGREAYPMDIARASYFLASGDAADITGAELVVDGGVDVQLFPGV